MTVIKDSVDDVQPSHVPPPTILNRTSSTAEVSAPPPYASRDIELAETNADDSEGPLYAANPDSVALSNENDSSYSNLRNLHVPPRSSPPRWIREEETLAHTRWSGMGQHNCIKVMSPLWHARRRTWLAQNIALDVDTSAHMKRRFYGDWIVESNEPSCKTLWENFQDKGYVAKGSMRRRIEAHMGNHQPPWDNWREMCSTTPRTMMGIVSILPSLFVYLTVQSLQGNSRISAIFRDDGREHWHGPISPRSRVALP
ncbi:uncharacterized protein BT62DRAFT_1011066 [Guyanagaster necrorhizus]|uniref:Uncharacterized protein n=1 Tax=Guyanagaster necrorhizus TaxID=856835 RepID=A0A9P7VJM2_9AGAR|nr:uncharacterized protein BT62DRAFT_1011066 [Guyanagaster necrorhizus MCA 3950]KAG7441773.1 hypothetical protein BT62DRAFT_1011066 [Guyanagaster necrorhizus MCA 3950]